MGTIGKPWIGVALSALAVVVLLTANARADFATTTITLNVANANLATQGAGPYATFDISLASGTVSLTATGLNGFVFGAVSAIDLNLSTAAGTVTNFTNVIPAGALTLVQSPPGTAQVDGFGKFNFIADDGNGFSSGGYPTLSFTFDISGTGINSLSALLATNKVGASAAAHMALATNTACTGYAGNGGPGGGTIDNPNCVPSAPDGGMTLMLLGGALAGLGALRWKLRA